ncbi:MAG: type 1 glutamine amidotransferase [Chloroflexota bacterium]
MKLTLGWLYGHEMNIYGDRGNVMALVRRAEWRGIDVEVQTIGLGDPLDAESIDLYFWGGGQDREQISVAEDLQKPKGAALRDAIEDGVPMLAICGGYQLSGHYYRPFEGEDLPGIGALNVWSEAGRERFIGNVVVDTPEFGELVGFENHSGLTFLGEGVAPLGTVRVGKGNNGRDGTAGARYRNVVGCYLHGALLPKNPQLTDWLLGKAIERSRGDAMLAELSDELELLAHSQVVGRAVRLGS